MKIKTTEIKKAIVKAIKHHAKIGENLFALNNPYEAIANHLPEGVGYDGIFPKNEIETDIGWAERVEGEIDTIWGNL